MTGALSKVGGRKWQLGRRGDVAAEVCGLMASLSFTTPSWKDHPGKIGCWSLCTPTTRGVYSLTISTLSMSSPLLVLLNLNLLTNLLLLTISYPSTSSCLVRAFLWWQIRRFAEVLMGLARGSRLLAPNFVAAPLSSRLQTSSGFPRERSSKQNNFNFILLSQHFAS